MELKPGNTAVELINEVKRRDPLLFSGKDPILEGLPRLQNQTDLLIASQLALHVEQYRKRLEIDHYYVHDPKLGESYTDKLNFRRVETENDDFPDAVECRDATIQMAEDARKRTRADFEAIRALTDEGVAKLDALLKDDKEMSAESRNRLGAVAATFTAIMLRAL